MRMRSLADYLVALKDEANIRRIEKRRWRERRQSGRRKSGNRFFATNPATTKDYRAGCDSTQSHPALSSPPAAAMIQPPAQPASLSPPAPTPRRRGDGMLYSTTPARSPATDRPQNITTLPHNAPSCAPMYPRRFARRKMLAFGSSSVALAARQRKATPTWPIEPTPRRSSKGVDYCGPPSKNRREDLPAGPAAHRTQRQRDSNRAPFR
ncbi:hypothetical protein BH10PSE14_BH10PSE14_41360 [soil metagenome]